MKNVLFLPLPTSLALAVVMALSSTTTYANDQNVMVVTASGFAQQIKDAPASISVITRDDLDKKPFRDLTDALKDIPGVTVTGGGGSSDISIRGMASKYTLILVDGKRRSSRESRPNSDGPGIEQGWIPPLSAIERIEVVRGPMSSLYGSDAMGGVINIITRKINREWGGSLRLESTFQENSDAGNPNNANFYLNGPVINNLLGVQLYGQYSERDEDKYIGGYPQQKLRSINSKFSLTPSEKHSFDLELGTSLQQRVSTTGNTAAKRGSDHHSRRENQSFSHNGHWGSATSNSAISHEKTNNYIRHMKIENTVLDSQVLLPLANHMLTLGGQYKKEKLNDQGNQFNPSLNTLDRWNYSLFTEDEWRLTENFALTGGLRYDYDENYGDNWNPRVYAVWDFTETFTLKGGISTGFTTPALRQVVADWGQITGGNRGRDGIILGNPDLKPEKTTNYELSLNYANDDGLNGNLTGFYTQFKDKIQSIYQCNDLSNSGLCVASNGSHFDFIEVRENVDKATLRGIETSVKVPLPGRVTLSSTYTWSDSKQKSGPNKGNPLNRIPKHVFNTSFDWQTTETIDSWLRVSYNGKETSVSSSTAGAVYAGYTTWDLGGSWRVNNKTTFYSGIYNLFNKEVRENNFGRTLDGRRYWLGVNVDF